jgi:hypothetical protein
VQVWDLYFPKAAATGLHFGRGRLDDTDVLLVHSADTLTVEVYDDDKNLLAKGKDLEKSADVPFTRLLRSGSDVRRQDGFWNEGDIGKPVILPGGEVGLLRSFWHADDASEWRWDVEFYNRR